MEETQISITIKPIYFERLLYWIIIIALSVLLVMAFMKDEACNDEETAKQNTQTTQSDTKQNTTEQNVQTAVPPEETCSDAKKNQDETDVDCGGIKCSACASGNVCTINADCISNICTAGKCTNTAPITLSGKFEFDLKSATWSAAANGAIKVTGISYKITNGLEDDLDGVTLRVFLKNKANTKCLNQVAGTSCDKEFAIVTLSALKSGKKIEADHEFTSDEAPAKFVQEGDAYIIGDDVTVVVFAYDDDGNEIGGKIISDSYLIAP